VNEERTHEFHDYDHTYKIIAKDECRICMDKEAMIMMTCGHVSMCKECYEKVAKDKCLICFKDTKLYHIF